MNPHERKKAQEVFRTEKQICVATEAAGEGINLQFCRLMINYDLPWNPTRLEQRLGRIHRIGQNATIHAFNFVAMNPRKASRSLKAESWSVFSKSLEPDACGPGRTACSMLSAKCCRSTKSICPTCSAKRLSTPADSTITSTRSQRIDPQRLKEYEQATGIALARANVDFSGFQQANAEAEERRLMPRYVEDHFVKAVERVGLKVEPRADGLWRVEHVLADLRIRAIAVGPPTGQAGDHLPQDHLPQGQARRRPAHRRRSHRTWPPALCRG